MKQIFSLFICCLFTIVIKAQQLIATSSAMFHGYAEENKNGHKPYQPVEGIQWKFKTKGKIFSSPTIINDIIFVGSEDKNLYAIDQHTGKQKWKFTTGGAVHSSPAIYGNNVYVG